MTKEQTFEELVNEWYTGTKAMIDRQEEILEQVDVRGIHFLELDKRGEKPPYEIRRIDDREIRNFAGTIGDKNPLYWNPAYAATTRYRTPIAPPHHRHAPPQRHSPWCQTKKRYVPYR